MQNRKNAEISGRIQESGYLCECDYGETLKRPELKIKCNPYESYAFPFRGGMGLIFDLRISSQSKILIQDFGDLEFENKYCNVDWRASEADINRFTGGPEFPREIVLNYRKGATVMPAKPFEGFLLGRSNRPIPSIYSAGFRLTFTFSILDGFDVSHTAQLFAIVDEHLHTEIKRPIRSSLTAINNPKEGDKINNVVPDRRSGLRRTI
jgi:hypothetical protein